MTALFIITTIFFFLTTLSGGLIIKWMVQNGGFEGAIEKLSIEALTNMKSQIELLEQENERLKLKNISQELTIKKLIK